MRCGSEMLKILAGRVQVYPPNSSQRRVLTRELGISIYFLIFSYRPLPEFHPNVVRVLTAFVDRMPILDDAKVVYPDALPTAPFYEMIINEPRTMFIVMKRYRMTLRDYLVDLKRKCEDRTARILFGQLLEGCVFLYNNIVAQRDMKSDNILLEFDDPEEVPHLVISDFGCALATGSWLVKYVDDTIDLGGNRRTRAPEIVVAKPSPNWYVSTNTNVGSNFAFYSRATFNYICSFEEFQRFGFSHG
ncbi:hypothetical protein ANCCEY_07510 [Ancylostoma ceylanicum]|uniref:non-specific serine/threonine protein kinase n=1 Tax=Ancylostoma ceylanicum TaxID=53326 RepID=A0A0D6LMU5_9BILA|nr:hypothetical protein ANCCEY_07510 [Ancylostoma ceylanicum]